MLVDRIEAKWIRAFERTFELCAVKQGDPIAILSETQSRQINVHLAELALLSLGARPFHLILPTPPQTVPVPLRSTGSSDAIRQLRPVMRALCSAAMVVDITVEGLMHAPETREILEAGSRVLYISNEHPELLERCVPDPALKSRMKKYLDILRGARTMRVTSGAGTDLTVDIEGAPAGGGWGACDEPGTLDHWPGGVVICYPKAGSTNGVVVLDRGDLNLTFKRYLDAPVELEIKDDYAVGVHGTGVDAELMRSYFAVWQDRNAYATSHVGFGINPNARWDALALYDKGEINGTEQRAYAGNFLYSTGANEFAGRFTLGHFDLPVRGCTIELDGKTVIDRGVLVDV
nr:peptidase M29 [Sphingomonas sp. Y57]